ncbi:1,6-anhydro-N-acetylmuramyl-L-alanine amidase AmpD [Massilia sp. PWRC2]|uniref:1,6-anhydro-N-acetylmuramyl-L-alanine amidase AmpD n=1 Tax=Massilia sp. PWRC2 TaxID=2804626 RepID=UPI003CF28FFE
MDAANTPAVELAIDSDGWWPPARRYDSPNYNARPAGTAIDLIVLHNISLPPGQFGGHHIADLFSNRLDFYVNAATADLRGLQVSSHFLVRRDGAVVQFVACGARAWHAGLSSFDGRDNCNDYSVGIELEGSDVVAFSPAQYDSLARLLAALLARYPIGAILGHQHVAPGRKTDPGPYFEWSKLQALLQSSTAMLVDANRPRGVAAELRKVKWPHASFD